MTNPPEQKQLWDAYGHAMGAATGLELYMRIALLDDARTRHAGSDLDRQAALQRILKKTFGQTADLFIKAYPALADTENYSTAMNNAVEFRNHLAHHFLEGRIHGLRSEEGVQLIALECIEYTQHFRQLEDFIRANCPADFESFSKEDLGLTDQWVNNHPLRQRLADIKAGKAPPPLS